MNLEEVPSLLNSSLKYIAKWRFVARSFCDDYKFNKPQIRHYIIIWSLFGAYLIENTKTIIQGEKSG